MSAISTALHRLIHEEDGCLGWKPFALGLIAAFKALFKIK